MLTLLAIPLAILYESWTDQLIGDTATIAVFLLSTISDRTAVRIAKFSPIVVSDAVLCCRSDSFPARFEPLLRLRSSFWSRWTSSSAMGCKRRAQRSQAFETTCPPSCSSFSSISSAIRSTYGAAARLWSSNGSYGSIIP